jgi:hypothetical protein
MIVFVTVASSDKPGVSIADRAFLSRSSHTELTDEGAKSLTEEDILLQSLQSLDENELQRCAAVGCIASDIFSAR